MLIDELEPRKETLSKDYVLVQAFKKTVPIIRYQNWFSDPLELDWKTINLPTFIKGVKERLQSSEPYEKDPLRIIPAPKSQEWKIDKNVWRPQKNVIKFRPLAHVSLEDQVLSTAIMLCLANRVETLQGNPAQNQSRNSSERVISFGNRLFCDEKDNNLFHRWGSKRLYREYFQDYKTFNTRWEKFISSQKDSRERFALIHSDLKQFYDRVTQNLFFSALEDIQEDTKEEDFFSFVKSFFFWEWHKKDKWEVNKYAEQTELEEFSNGVVLPQGLIASGFFANLVLLKFDKNLRDNIGKEILPGVELIDICRYVDDLRILVKLTDYRNSATEIEEKIPKWLGNILTVTSPGLEVSSEKTKIEFLGNNNRPIIPQQEKMNRIQTTVSGGFDIAEGEEVLDQIQGLIQAQKSSELNLVNTWHLAPVPDVKDDTVARFGAMRYRNISRSIRPLLPDKKEIDKRYENEEEEEWGLQLQFTKEDLDNNTKAFAYDLINRWIKDPSNVRILRIALDLWPDSSLLREIFNLLEPYTKPRGKSGIPSRVAWYCLAEIFRAGYMETGLVQDKDSLPSGLNLTKYRETLCSKAIQILDNKRNKGWYLWQQAYLLFISVYFPNFTQKDISKPKGSELETALYRSLLKFLEKDDTDLKAVEFASFAVLARRSILDKQKGIELIKTRLNSSRVYNLAEKDPSFFLELQSNDLLPHKHLREDLCIDYIPKVGEYTSLAKEVLQNRSNQFLRNELSLLVFAREFLKEWETLNYSLEKITPGQVFVKFNNQEKIVTKLSLKIMDTEYKNNNSIYQVPSWCNHSNKWRLQLGYILRFILTQQPDFTLPEHKSNWKETLPVYRPAESHWYLRLFGLYNGRIAFGDDWIPITDWMEMFLLALMHWPGCRINPKFNWINQGIAKSKDKIQQRIKELEKLYGKASGTLFLPIRINPPGIFKEDRKLRICVVQSAKPSINSLKSDLTQDLPNLRTENRNHLAASLTAVKRMLRLRGTLDEKDSQIDWLIFPELAVHPSDVDTHLKPFARAYKSIILTGINYQEIFPSKPLINSALWVIPEWTKSNGFTIRTCRQGKKHLSPEELELNPNNAAPTIQGFRPCQWLIGFPWSNSKKKPRLNLSATICYDATDLGIVTDLRDTSDILAIPALNKDVKTFHHMAKALHYHMYQIVMIVNNGLYGGSNAYWPKKKDYIRQIFLTQGQPQVSISFLEIDNIRKYLRRKYPPVGKNGWKYPPAAYNPKKIS